MTDTTAPDFAAIAGAAKTTAVPQVTIVREKEVNPFVELVKARNKDRGTAVALPFSGDDKAFAKLRRFLSDAATAEGISIRTKREKDSVTVWATDLVKRAPRKPKDETVSEQTVIASAPVKGK